MGRRGPKHKPTNLKILEGNPGRRALNVTEPLPTGEAQCPGHLQPQARAMWADLLEAMPPGLYTAADVPVLAAFCEAWADHVRATEELAVGSLTTPRGGKSPLVAIRNDAARTMAALGTRLGLSPADRANLRMPAEDMGGKWAGLVG